MAWVGVVTNVGAQMLEQVVGGATMTFTAAQTGSGTTANMAAATSVSSPEWSGGMTSQTESDGVRLKIRVPAIADGYTMKQIGLFAKLGSGSEQLFALLQNTDGISIPDASLFPDFVYNMSTFVACSNASNISVTVDTSSVVSMSDLEEAMENVVTLDREFYASTTSVTCPIAVNQKVFIITSSAASGTNGGIMDATSGALIIISNGNYAVLHKGSGITITVSGGNLTVSSASSVAMSVVEL